MVFNEILQFVGVMSSAILAVAMLVASINRRQRRWSRRIRSLAKRAKSAPPSNRQVCAAPRSPATDPVVEHLPHARVDWVIDGDTVIVERNGRREKVRLDAIDCPEDGQPWGDIATAGLIKLIGGRRIRMEVHGTDCYGRTLATLYVPGKEAGTWLNVNERMVVLGHAWVMRRHYGHLARERQVRLNRAARWARSKGVGLWRQENPVPPWKWRADVADSQLSA